MTGRLLTLNAGSSSLKFAVFDAAGPFERALQSGQEAVGAQSHETALATVLRSLAESGAPIVGVGHRVVHGGVEFEGAAVVDDAVLARIAALEPLAPLHQPHAVAGIRGAVAAFPRVMQVACFDTAFHRTLSEVQQRFAIPQEWHARGIRRYGFHGLSYASIAARLGERASGRVVVAHLGNGASLCAMRGGRSVATTMSFSPLDGLTMGTRAGHIDAAAVLHLQRAHGLGVADVEALLARRSGLLGLSGVSSDMRELEASAAPGAALAIAHFVERLAEGIAAMAAALRGIDTLVFTAGIGENAAGLRKRVVEACAWLGFELDEAANRSGGPLISAPGSRAELLVLRSDEEAVIASQTAALLTMTSHAA